MNFICFCTADATAFAKLRVSVTCGTEQNKSVKTDELSSFPRRQKTKEIEDPVLDTSTGGKETTDVRIPSIATTASHQSTHHLS